MVDFPQLDEKRLHELTCWSYQLRLSSSYAQEHIKGENANHTHEEEKGILRILMQSQDVSCKTYQLWIKYKDVDTCIIALYCKCRAGVRGCWHVRPCIIMWYLGFVPHRHNVTKLEYMTARVELLENQMPEQ